MYPETDIRPVEITAAMLKNAEDSKPDIAKATSALKKSLGEQLAMQLLKSTRLAQFERISGMASADRRFIANMLLQQFTELRRNGYDVDAISDDKLVELLNYYENGIITKQAVTEVLKALARSDMAVEQAIKSNNLERIRGSKLMALVSGAAKELNSKDSKTLLQYIMSKHRLNVDGSELNEAIERL